MTNQVVLHSHDSDGQALTVTITQTGPTNANIRKGGSGSELDQDVKNVQADPAGLALACNIDAFLVTGDIEVVVQRGAGDQTPVASITVSHALAGNGTYVFQLGSGDDAAVEAFLQQAGFPPIASV